MKPIQISKEKLKSLDLGSTYYNKGWICEVISIDYSRAKIGLKKLFKKK